MSVAEARELKSLRFLYAGNAPMDLGTAMDLLLLIAAAAVPFFIYCLRHLRAGAELPQKALSRAFLIEEFRE